MEKYVKITVDGETVCKVYTNHSMTVEEALLCAGYDISEQNDCRRGYENCVPGFYLDDCGNYCFDIEAAAYESNIY